MSDPMQVAASERAKIISGLIQGIATGKPDAFADFIINANFAEDSLMMSVRCAQVATSFMRTLRAQASWGYLVRPGKSEVEVVSGRHTPHEYYEVARHYYGHSGAAVDLRDIISGQRFTDVPLTVCRILPNYAGVFPAATFGDASYEVFPGMAAEGFTKLSWLKFADWIVEHGFKWVVPENVDHGAGIDLELLARNFRDTSDCSGYCGHAAPSWEVQQLNADPRRPHPMRDV